MARYMELTQDEEREWQEWVSSRPAIIQDMVTRIPPGFLYRMKSTGQRVIPHGYNEDGTMSVIVSGKFNFVTHERIVFGIDPADLEECDLPMTEELLGNLDLPVDLLKTLL